MKGGKQHVEQKSIAASQKNSLFVALKQSGNTDLKENAREIYPPRSSNTQVHDISEDHKRQGNSAARPAHRGTLVEWP